MPNSNENSSSTPDTTQIASVAVKPPPFWKSNPALWFVRLESQFSLAGITVDDTKFNYVISAVDSDILNSVSDIILKPPENEKYKTLKEKLIDLHSESEASKIRTLLQGLELGDQRPSQLLTRMRALAGDTVGEALLKSLWLSRLPSGTQTILAALNEDLNGLAAVADKISDLASNSHINLVHSTNTAPDPRIDHLERQIANLTTMVSEIRTQRNSRSRSRKNSFKRYSSSSRDRTKNYKEPENGFCFYHTNFGKHAKKCKSPCTFNQEN